MRTTLVSFVLSLSVVASGWAHTCGGSPITMRVGQTKSYRIKADVEESQASHYNLSINSDPNIAVSLQDNFNSFGYGEFDFVAKNPGTNNVVLEWSYAPNSASGFCVVQIIVLPRATNVADNATETTSEQVEESGTSTDPVNTYTGEYVLEEPSDFDLGGPMPVRFTRYYASGLNRNGLVQSTVGNNWMHNYELRLIRSGTNVTVVFHGGQILPFEFRNNEWVRANEMATPFALKELAGNLLLLDPQKNWIYTFDSEGKLTLIQDTRGNALTILYAGGQVSSVSDGLGRTLTFRYEGFQELFTVSDGTRTVTFSYAQGNLAQVQDRVGGITRYSYDNSKARGGLLTAKAFPDGNTPTTQEYDTKGRVIRQTRAEGGNFSFSYNGLETTITNPNGQTQRHIHNGRGNLTQLSNEKQEAIQTSFDTTGRRVQEITRSGRIIRWEYHPESGKLSSISAPGGTTVRFERQPRSFSGFQLYDIAKIIYADQTTEEFTYDTAGNIAAITDRAGRQFFYGYDNHGRMTGATNPAGGVYAYQNNSDGTRTRQTRNSITAGNETILYSYDGLKRLSRIEYADGKSRSFTYDAADQLLTATDEDGKIVRYEYTKNGLIKKLTYPLGSTIQFFYNRMDDLTNVTDHAGNFVARGYDNLGRLISLTDRNRNTQRFEYDELSHMAAYIDGEGNRWRREYDNESRLISITDPLQHSRSYTYDAASRVVAIDGPESESLRFNYDVLGRPVQMEFPPGSATLLKYEADGALQQVTLPGGIASTWSRGPLGENAALQDPNGKSWRSLTDKLGRPAGFVDPLLRTNGFVLDGRSMLMREVFPAGLGNTDFEYNGRGQVTKKTYSDGTILNFGYDDNGRLNSGSGITLAYDSQDEITQSNGLNIERDKGGRITSVTLAVGKIIRYAYDQRNLVTNITDWIGGSTTLTYDGVGRLISIRRPNNVQTSYSYDAADRLVGIQCAGASPIARIQLTRDARGQITRAEKDLPLQLSSSGPREVRSFDAASQVVGVDYDGLGRATKDGSRVFKWDLASRLKEFSNGATTATFEYDSFGDLLSRTEAGHKYDYIWNYALLLRSPVIIRDNGSDSLYAVHTPGGELLYLIEAGSNARRYCHFDEAGNTLFLTDDSGAVTDSYAYSPYGRVQQSQGNFSNPFTFGGRYSTISFSSGSIFNMRHRWYDAVTGRFLSRDPNFGRSINPNESNPYAFSRSNPLLHTDPLGLNARVNQSGVHTDISVDVWDGDRIVGTLTLSFAAKGYKGNFGGVGEAFCTVLWGTAGEFSVDYKRGSINQTTDPTRVAGGSQIIIEGTREQDERLALVFAGIIGSYDDDPNPNRGQRIIRDLIRKARDKKTQSFTMDATVEDWETYRAVSNCCNDFTDAMLDIYFGENWYLGPIFQGEGLVEELKKYLTPPTPPPATPAVSGVAPITGQTFTGQR